LFRFQKKVFEKTTGTNNCLKQTEFERARIGKGINKIIGTGNTKGTPCKKE